LLTAASSKEIVEAAALGDAQMLKAHGYQPPEIKVGSRARL
jgi:hypothetical protein